MTWSERLTDTFDPEVYSDTDPDNLAPDDDGLPGARVDGYPGLRAGAFGVGKGALGMLRVEGLPQDGDDATLYPAAVGQASQDPPWTHSPLTFCPVPGHTRLMPASPMTGQGDGRFGPTRDRGTKQHWGVDYDAPIGTPVVAAGDGVVVDIRPNPSASFGHQVVIDHGGGVYTQSAHMSRVDVKPGQAVYAGLPIGLSGDSGNAKGSPQVHFEVRQGSPAPKKAHGNPVDPSGYLPPWCFP